MIFLTIFWISTSTFPNNLIIYVHIKHSHFHEGKNVISFFFKNLEYICKKILKITSTQKSDQKRNQPIKKNNNKIVRNPCIYNDTHTLPTSHSLLHS